MSRKPALRLENLEARQMMYGGSATGEALFSEPPPDFPSIELAKNEQAPPVKVFLDFGFDFPGTPVVQGGVERYFDLTPNVAAIYGPNSAVELLTPFDDASVYAPDPIYFEYLNSLEDVLRDLGVDYNQDGEIDFADASSLGEDVRDLVARTFEPFNVEVEIVSSSNWTEALQVLADSEANDLYLFVGGKYNGSSVLGIAPRDSGNEHDDFGYVFAEDTLSKVLDEGDLYYLATSLAKAAAHEGSHSFGLQHTNVGQGNGGELMDVAGGNAKLTDVTIAMRGSEFVIQGSFSTQDSYAVLADAVGLRPDGPDYITGTSYHDKITVEQNAFGDWWATVEAYGDSDHTQLRDSFAYRVDPEHGLLIEAGRGDDRVTIHGDVDATIRGGQGDDVLIGGAGNDVLEGEEGTDTLYGYDGDDVYRFGFGALDLGKDYLVDLGDGESTLDFSDFRGPVRVDLAQSGVQQVGVGDAQVELYTWSILPIDNVIGTEFGDTLLGTSAANRIVGMGGQDRIDGRGGRDEIFADYPTLGKEDGKMNLLSTTKTTTLQRI